MYSVVLAAAMMTAPVAPEFGGRNRGGCSGCYGCSGCGGGRGGFLGLGLFSPSSSRFGSGCTGCSGCSGSYSMSCYGSYSMSCYGGCYGSSYGYAGEYAEGHGMPSYPMTMGPAFADNMPSMGMGMGMGDLQPYPPPMAMGPNLGIDITPPMTGGPNLGVIEPPLAAPQPDVGLAPAPSGVRPSELLPPPNLNVDASFATVVVTLPADAKLFVEGQEWFSDVGQTTRTFRTPALDPGRQYYYAFRIEVQRGGRTVTLNQEVTLQAGKTARVTFADPGTTASRSVAAAFAMMRNE